MVLTIRPELVDTGSYGEAAKGASSEFGVAKIGTQLTVDTIDFSRSGATLDRVKRRLKPVNRFVPLQNVACLA